ncbi:putative periplasmic chaperone protein [Caballeronia pedi]|uniref:Periplasmic chaperone protein n=1 Tax=Caballeronia pedi TaxID=1777141 RepID=A0A158A1A1_9BURK|nr:fimbria/pilus periplasmic chaperone [Caballeronia pedi]SAK51446.1 putative periplasmic chaperone protein [Caballeronia pedi]
MSQNKKLKKIWFKLLPQSRPKRRFARKGHLDRPSLHQGGHERRSELQNALSFDKQCVVLGSDTRYARLKLRNVGTNQLIVYSSMHRLPESQATSVFVMPSLCQIDVGDSAIIEFSLVARDVACEELFRARFEWIRATPNLSADEAETSLPLLVRPFGIVPTNAIHESVFARLTEHGDVIIENSSARVLRLRPELILLPSMSTFIAPQRYVAAFSWMLVRNISAPMQSVAVRITVESFTGESALTVDLPLDLRTKHSAVTAQIAGVN